MTSVAPYMYVPSNTFMYTRVHVSLVNHLYHGKGYKLTIDDFFFYWLRHKLELSKLDTEILFGIMQGIHGHLKHTSFLENHFQPIHVHVYMHET